MSNKFLNTPALVTRGMYLKKEAPADKIEAEKDPGSYHEEPDDIH